MSDGPKPMHPSIANQHKHFQDGVHDLPGARDLHRTPLERAAYEQGKRIREMGRVNQGPGRPKQTLGEAIFVAFALAGTAAGFVYGLRRIGDGEGTWLEAFGLAAAGAVAGLSVWGVIAWSFGRVRTAILWRRGRDERDAEMLVSMWEARFGQPIDPELVGEVDDDGRGWTMDGRGNFHLRMKSGRVVFVGLIDGDLRTESGGRGGSPMDNAYHTVLIHKSLGHQKMKVTEGSKKQRRLMWVAASLADVEVEGYTPDGKAVRLLAEMKRDPGRDTGPEVTPGPSQG